MSPYNHTLLMRVLLNTLYAIILNILCSNFKIIILMIVLFTVYNYRNVLIYCYFSLLISITCILFFGNLVFRVFRGFR